MASSDALGNPVGLLGNVGTGVKVSERREYKAKGVESSVVSALALLISGPDIVLLGRG